MEKSDWLVACFMVFVILFFGLIGWGIQNDQTRRHECRMKMIEQNKPAAEIKEICRT
jgi:hypothetical protein